MPAATAQRNSALRTPPIPDRAASASRESAAGMQASQQKRAAQQPLQSTFSGCILLTGSFLRGCARQRTTVERGKLRKALGAEKPLKLHEIIPGFGIVFIFDVDAVKQTFVVVDSLFHNSICQKLKAPFGNKGLEGDDRQLCCIRFIQGRKSRRQVGGLSV